MKNHAVRRMTIAIAILFSAFTAMSFTTSDAVLEDPITASMAQPSEGIVHMYLYNSSSETVRVYYHLEGSTNVYISSDGGITDVPPGEKVWIITTTIAGPGDWSTGDLKYSW
jgi:hypothetical protein